MSKPLLIAAIVAAASAPARADEPVCNRVLPKSVIPYYGGRVNPTSVCFADHALAEDNLAAGLDYGAGTSLLTMAGVPVAGCIIVDFRLSEQFREPTTLSSVTIIARPHANVCAQARTPCQPPYCGTGQDFLVFAKGPRGARDPFVLVQRFTAATPNWSEYKVSTLNRYATEVLAICRTGNGPARDDIAIDAVKGCAFRTR